MKKISILSFVLGIMAMSSCQKNLVEGPATTEPSVAPTSFVASAPMTKTSLSDHTVTWAANDSITVFGHNTATDAFDQAVFVISDGVGSGSAVFTIKPGQTLSGSYDNFYAVYPAGLSVTGLPSKITLPRLNSFPHNLRNQRPAEGGFDPLLAIMTANYDGSKLLFRHAVSYVKITVPIAGVTKVEVDFQNNCLADTPTYNADSGSINSVGNSSKSIAGGTDGGTTLVEGQSYYLAAIPRSGYSIGTTKVTYTTADGSVSVSTDHFSGKSVELGNIFDLGSPMKVTSPIITFSAPSKLAFDAEEGSFTYDITNAPTDAAATAEITSGTWISNVVVNGKTVTFDCEKNNAANAVERTAVITLKYTGAEDKEVTITQGIDGGSSAPSVNTYLLYVDGNKNLVNTSGYFNLGSGTSILDCESSNYFGSATSYTINGVSYRYARKLDGSNPVSFTVNSEATAT